MKTVKIKGKVKGFDSTKGYGFAVSDELPEDIFIHYSDIKMDGFRSLEVGDIVDLEVAMLETGLKAVSIIPEQKDQTDMLLAVAEFKKRLQDCDI